MADSKFAIAVIRLDGAPIYLKPGGHSERDLGALLAAKLVAKGVGIFRSQARVLAALDEALAETLHELKSDVLPVY